MTSAVLCIDDIERIIREEAAAQGGYVHELLCDEERLYARTINTPISEVAPGDAVQAGVAVRVDGPEVWVRPYIFRQICSNGAISATSDEAVEFSLGTIGSTEAQEDHFRGTIMACGHAKVLPREVARFRSFREQSVNKAMMMIAMMQTHLRKATHSELLDILAQFDREEGSAWGAMNAITAVAQRIRDSERKWRLEEIGALVPAVISDRFRIGSDALEYESLLSQADEECRDLVHA